MNCGYVLRMDFDLSKGHGRLRVSPEGRRSTAQGKRSREAASATPGMADCYDCSSPEGAAEIDMSNPFKKRKSQSKQLYNMLMIRH